MDARPPLDARDPALSKSAPGLLTTEAVVPQLNVPADSAEASSKRHTIANPLVRSMDHLVDDGGYLASSGAFKNPLLLRVKEFGNQSPNSPNLRRLTDPSIKEEQLQKTAQIEDSEKHVRGLMPIMGLAPPRAIGMKNEFKCKFEYSADKLVVSHPIKLADLRSVPWYTLEERLAKEFDEVRNVSLKLMWGSTEKEKRIGRGAMEEPVFTVAPFKDHRVKLVKPVQSAKEEDASFYNASWIGKDFIAAAMPQTMAARFNFWRLVWDYDITTIVMLNEDNEQAHRTATIDVQRYWPNTINEWERYGVVDVLKVEQLNMRNAGAIVRKLKLRALGSNGPFKEVSHIQYRDWPDGGLPAERDDFKDFVKFLLQLSRSLRDTNRGAVLVHCFGGKGRTGTTIATLLELQKLEQFAGDEIDVCGTISEMRTFRPLLVETLEQYKFVVWAVATLADSVLNPKENKAVRASSNK